MSKVTADIIQSRQTSDSVKVKDLLAYPIQSREYVKRLAAEAGFNLVDGSFEEGAVISSWPDVVWYQADGKYYQWHLDEAKTVAAGATPATSGGVGAGAWVDRTDLTLRSEINVVVKRFSSVADMVADASLQVGQVVETIGYHTIGDGGGARYLIISGISGDGFSRHTIASGCTAKLIIGEDVTIKQFGAKMDMASDDAPCISAMVSLLGIAKCPSVGAYENWEFGNTLTHGVLIASDIVTKSFDVYDFGYNQVKIANGAAFIPNNSNTFTVKVTWKNLYIVDSSGQEFIRADGSHYFESPSIENININTLENLMSASGGYGWFNLSITHIKAISLQALFRLANANGQTGNTVTDGLFQNTGTLIDVENATCQCTFSGINYGIDRDTLSSAIIYFRGSTVNTASDRLTFINSFFEYDDTASLAQILKTSTSSNYDIVFDNCGLFHANLTSMNASRKYPIELTGNNNRLTMKGTTTWFSRYIEAQGIMLYAPSGNVYNYDLPTFSISFADNYSRIRNIEQLFTMADSSNVNFLSGSYSIQNNRLIVNFYGITTASIASGTQIYKFPNLASFANNVFHQSYYKLTARATNGDIIASESIPSGAGVSCNMIIDLSSHS